MKKGSETRCTEEICVLGHCVHDFVDVVDGKPAQWAVLLQPLYFAVVQVAVDALLAEDVAAWRDGRRLNLVKAHGARAVAYNGTSGQSEGVKTRRRGFRERILTDTCRCTQRNCA